MYMNMCQLHCTSQEYYPQKSLNYSKSKTGLADFAQLKLFYMCAIRQSVLCYDVIHLLQFWFLHNKFSCPPSRVLLTNFVDSLYLGYGETLSISCSEA